MSNKKDNLRHKVSMNISKEFPLKINLSYLRREAPGWIWIAERFGFGWRYIGLLGNHSVTVQAFGQLCGPSDDDYITIWRVLDGGISFELFDWILRRI